MSRFGIRAGVQRLFRLDFRRPEDARADADDELCAVLDARVEYLVARGMTPEDARADAVRRMGGNLDDARRQLHHSAQLRERQMQLSERFDDLLSDVRYAARSLHREPLFSAFVVVTLALGIGANAAMFGIVDRLLLRGPEHVRDAGRVMRLYSTVRSRSGVDETTSRFGYVSYAIMRDEAHSFGGVAGYQIREGTIGRGIGAQKVSTGSATASLFPLLGVRPVLGRFFTADEDLTSGAEHVAVLGYQIWQRLFGGSADVLGTSVLLGDESYMVIGVAPKGFTGAELGTVDIWTPFSLMGSRMSGNWATSWSWDGIRVIARLEPGVTPAQAGADATAAHRHSYTGGDNAVAAARLTLAPLAFNDQGKEPAEFSVSRWLIGVATVVLLVACANIVNLLLARAARRRREIAVRLALGAGRSRLVRLLLVEGMLLAVCGGAAGLGIAYAMGQLVRRALLVNVEWTSSPVDARVLTVAAIVALGTGLLVGLAPALQASSPNLTAALKLGGRDGGGRQSRLRTALTLVQAALSVVLLIGAGLFARSVRNVSTMELGVQADRVLAFPITLPLARSDTSKALMDAWLARRAGFYGRVLERVRQLPEVDGASLAIGVPFRSFYGVGFSIPGRDSLPELRGRSPRIQAVGSDYFATVGTPIVRGRAFAPTEGAGAERVAIVSDHLARTLWPNEDAIGQCIVLRFRTAPCARIVGIAANTYTSDIAEEPGMQYYVPFEQAPFGGMANLVIRPARDPRALVGTVRRALLDVDSTLAYLDIKTLRQVMDPQLRPWRLGATIFGLMGGLALLVAAVGLYSVVSYLVTQRTHEFGVRLALGARGGNIIGLIFRHSAGTASVGIGIGIVLALMGGRFVQPLLFRTTANDPVIIGTVAVTMMAVAILAGVIPALRARRVNPVEALRYD
jgi:predicted permease